MQLLGTKRLRDGRQMLPAGGYSEPTENQGIMDMETGEIIALSKKDQRIADAKKNRKEIMEKLQAKVDKENAEAAKPKPKARIVSSTEAMARRSIDAENKFIESAKREGLSQSDAQKVFDYYVASGDMKVDMVTGDYRVKHGSLLTSKVLGIVSDGLKTGELKMPAPKQTGRKRQSAKTPQEKPQAKGNEAKEKKPRKPRNLPSLSQISDFDPQNDRIVNRNGRTFIESNSYAPVEIKPLRANRKPVPSTIAKPTKPSKEQITPRVREIAGMSLKKYLAQERKELKAMGVSDRDMSQVLEGAKGRHKMYKEWVNME